MIELTIKYKFKLQDIFDVCTAISDNSHNIEIEVSKITILPDVAVSTNNTSSTSVQEALDILNAKAKAKLPF